MAFFFLSFSYYEGGGGSLLSLLPTSLQSTLIKMDTFCLRIGLNYHRFNVEIGG